MNAERTPDPNKERNDPMVAEYWNLGEDLQDKLGAAGYEHDEVEPLAVDVHDILQAADVIREALESQPLAEAVNTVLFELRHIRWHCESAEAYLQQAQQSLGQ
jgi:hypothetical protein